MKTAIIILVLPLFLWSLMRAVIIPMLSSRSAAGGVVDGELALCKSQLNCVSSLDAEKKPVAALDFKSAKQSDWQAFLDSLASLPGIKPIKLDGDYAHFESRTPLMNFKDDLELLWKRESATISVRSSSRLGIKDFNANKDRIDMIRKLLEIQMR